MLKIKGAIFDMDGVLLDSMSIWDTMGSRYLLRRGIAPAPDIDYYFRSLSLREAAEHFKSAYGLPESTEFIMDDINAMTEKFYRFEAPAKPGVEGVLQRLRDFGVRMCVATATDLYLVEAALGRNGLLGYFERIFTCTEVGAGKTSPLIFETAIDFLGTPRESTYVFEDSLFAIETCKKAGIPTVAVSDASSEDCKEQIRALADFYIDSFEEFRRLTDV